MVRAVGYRFWAAIVVVVALIIVGSFFFLETSNSPRPRTYDDIGSELGSGRIVRPEQGFAVTTPPGWMAWEPSTGFQDWWGADTVVHLWMEPAAETETWWMGTCGIGQRCTHERMVEAGGEAYCWIIDDTELANEAAWSGPATPAAQIATGLAAQEGWSEVGTAIETMPNGEAAMVRATDPNGWPQQMWHVTDGDRWFRLMCGLLDSDVQPRTIVESLEFLPVSG